ncbi:MAG: PatB family C-S lyase [Spirochaetes bacterium]|nr:PatB family C-S lyase [Spirochaetota bacterium]
MTNIFDHPIDRRGTDSEKWDRYDPDVLPLWVADMDFPSAEPIVQALGERIEHRVFGYTNEIRGLREAILAWLEERHRWKVKAEDIVFLPGVVVGFNLTARAFGTASIVRSVSIPTATEARGVLIQPPVYPPFLSVGKNAGIPLFENPLIRVKDRTTESEGDPQPAEHIKYEIDLDHFRTCLNQRPSLFLLCNPHNPVGRVYTRAELEVIADVCLKTKTLICSDEIHADLVFSGHTHIPIASIDPDIANRTITLMAPSKTFNIPSLEFAFAVIPNPQLRKQFQEARRGLVGEVNLFGMVAAKAAYKNGAPWLDEVLQYLEGNRDYLKRYVQERLPGIGMNNPEGTYLAWLNCEGLIEKSPEAFQSGTAAFFLEHARVGLNEGTTFGTGGEGCVRLNFACPRSTLQEALIRMEDAVKRITLRASTAC